MPPLHIVEQGAKISITSRRLVVTKGEQQLAVVPLIKIDSVVLFGNVGITTPAMKRLMRAGKDVIFMTIHGQYEGRLLGPSSGYGHRRLAQYKRVGDSQFALQTAQAIVAGKLRNQCAVLTRRNQRSPDPQVTEAISRLEDYAARAGRTTQLNALRGVEGSGAACYFGAFRCIIPGGDKLCFERRARRPPPDPVNVLLSFGYTLLTNNLLSAINMVGLDPYLGFLHELAYNRPSLALDLVEEFRPLVVDGLALEVLQNGVISSDDFTPGADPQRPLVFGDEGRKRFLASFESRLSQRFHHPESDEQVDYRRCFELQTRRLAGCLDSGEQYQPFSVNRKR